MHRQVREHIEEVLDEGLNQRGPSTNAPAQAAIGGHLAQCRECGDEVNAMRQQAALLRQWRAPENVDVEPRPGFYARVLERIEAEGPGSIWSLFFESASGRGLAIASLALAALLCVVLLSWERFGETNSQAIEIAQPLAPVQVIMGEDQPGLVLTGALDSAPDQDSVLVNLVTYREQ